VRGVCYPRALIQNEWKRSGCDCHTAHADDANALRTPIANGSLPKIKLTLIGKPADQVTMHYLWLLDQAFVLCCSHSHKGSNPPSTGLSRSYMAALSSNGNRCTAPVTVFGVENVPIDIEAIELPAFRTWPTAAAGGLVAPSGANSRPQHTRQAVIPRALLHVHIGAKFSD
jgi:hypothetical protein